MGNEQDVLEVILNDGDQNLMGVSEILWDGFCNGNINIDGSNLYENDSKGRKVRGSFVDLKYL